MLKVPSLTSETNELRELDAMIAETLKYSDKMKDDILESSSDPRCELQSLRESLMEIGEVQRDLAGLRCAVSNMQSEIEQEGIGNNYQRVLVQFEGFHEIALDEQFLDDDVERITAAVDSYLDGQGDDGDGDSQELLVTAITECYKDPLTKLLLKDPVKSKICHHTYEKSSIIKYLQRSSKCPYSGCVTILKSEDLIEDLQMKRKLLNMSGNQNDAED